jgi:hypothetical protein
MHRVLGLIPHIPTTKEKFSWARWLTPRIPATLEAEIRRISGGNQPGQKVNETLSQSISLVWWCLSVIPAKWEAIGRRILV